MHGKRKIAAVKCQLLVFRAELLGNWICGGDFHFLTSAFHGNEQIVLETQWIETLYILINNKQILVNS